MKLQPWMIGLAVLLYSATSTRGARAALPSPRPDDDDDDDEGASELDGELPDVGPTPSPRPPTPPRPGPSPGPGPAPSPAPDDSQAIRDAISDMVQELDASVPTPQPPTPRPPTPRPPTPRPPMPRPPTPRPPTPRPPVPRPPTPPPPVPPPQPIAPSPEIPPGYDPDKARRMAKAVSNHLKRAGISNYDRRMVRNFQTFAGIAVDGWYGGGTRGALLHYGAKDPPKPFFKPTETLTYTPPELR